VLADQKSLFNQLAPYSAPLFWMGSGDSNRPLPHRSAYDPRHSPPPAQRLINGSHDTSNTNLLIRAHGGLVIIPFAFHQPKAFAKFMMGFLFVVPDHIQPAAVQRPVRAEGGHEHVSAGLD
jgi:hypothetical protein